MAQVQEMLGRRERAPFVVDRDGAVLGEGRRIDEHDREAGVADVLHVRVILAEADGDEAVDAGSLHGPGK